jgi:hypothetical protein
MGLVSFKQGKTSWAQARLSLRNGYVHKQNFGMIMPANNKRN